jgi:hypothetical protein
MHGRHTPIVTTESTSADHHAVGRSRALLGHHLFPSSHATTEYWKWAVYGKRDKF